jgi:hypothetical protein
MKPIIPPANPTVPASEPAGLAQILPTIPEQVLEPIGHPDAQALAGLALDAETQADREKMFRRISCGC